jgi:quinoprotein glucose dehydrogenase
VQRDGKPVDAVAQTSKQGFVYLFNRLTGEPLFPLETKAYPASTVPGEVAAEQQPLPTKPAPFARQVLTEDMLTERTPEAHRWALENFKKFRSEGQFIPLSVGKETIVFPGFDGAAEWGGPAFNPQTGILYINSNEMAWNAMLAETPDVSGVRAIYVSQCAVCHRDDMQGDPPSIPSLAAVGSRLSNAQIGQIVRDGKGRMPGFPNLTPEQSNAITYFLASGNDKEIVSSAPQLPAMKYHLTGYNRFLDPDGYPAIAPPWGTLNAININTGEFVWKIPFGEYPELTAAGMKNTGSENYGGPIITAGGLLFIGASNFDRKFRAYNSSTGELLWQANLPFSGNATPATYSTNGRQYVVIAAGGGKDRKSKSGGVYVAFALPTDQH